MIDTAEYRPWRRAMNRSRFVLFHRKIQYWHRKSESQNLDDCFADIYIQLFIYILITPYTGYIMSDPMHPFFFFPTKTQLCRKTNLIKISKFRSDSRPYIIVPLRICPWYHHQPKNNIHTRCMRKAGRRAHGKVRSVVSPTLVWEFGNLVGAFNFCKMMLPVSIVDASQRSSVLTWYISTCYINSC